MSTNTITMNQMEMVVSHGITADDIKVQLEAKAKAAVEKVMSNASAEVVSPADWWEILAFGPIQPGASTLPPANFTDPLLSHQVIRRDQDAFVASIIVLNPFGPIAPSACELLQTFGLPYEVEFQIANTTLMVPVATLTSSGNFDPNGFCVYVNVVKLPTNQPGLYQANVTGRIFGCEGNGAPPFSGFARQVIDLDAELFQAPAGPQFDLPIRYQVYE